MTSPWWLLSAAAGVASAVLYGVTPGSPLGAMLAAVLVAAALFMAGLGLGTMAGATASAVGVLAAMAIHGPVSGATFALSFGVPVAILVRQAMLSRSVDGETEWYPTGLLAATLTIIGLGMALAYTAILPTLGVLEQAEALLRTFAESFAASSDEITVEELMDQIKWVMRLLPGMLTGFWMLALLAGGALAQTVLERMQRNLRPRPDFAGMRLPNWMAAVAAVTMAGAMFVPDPAGLYAVSMAFAACFGFLMQGLAVVHAFNRKIRGGMILLVIFYLLVFVPVWPAMLLVLLGAVEQFAGFRRGWTRETET
ncbi:MAG: DUF2232 domain-containing protein [Alphaproteobacteria bacterium]|nr:DUF2232 domain-containing protein [Alphaproteobacteria bacterium]